MVLTNFECWAHGDASGQFEQQLQSRNNIDVFNPRSVMATCGTAVQESNATDAAAAYALKGVSHISSNGYYGFSYVNAAHTPAVELNNNVYTSNANCVNEVGMNSVLPFNDNEMTVDIDLNSVCGADDGSSAAQHQPCAVNVVAGNMFSNRKKRYFIDEDDFINMSNDDNNTIVAAKRCRLDNNCFGGVDDVAAQYCNDFFQMSCNQIGTQASLMDTEVQYQQQQHHHPLHQQQNQQVDVIPLGVTPTINNAFTKSNSCSNFELHSQGQSNAQLLQPPPTPPTSSLSNINSVNNRDISRCIYSHMI